MTWDIYALKSRGARRVEDIPADYVPPVVAEVDEVVARIREVAPHVDASDRRWLKVRGDDHAIEVALGNDVQVRQLTFYIESGEAAVPLVLAMCDQLRVTPYDTESGEVLTETSRREGPPPVEEDDEPEARSWWSRLRRR